MSTDISSTVTATSVMLGAYGFFYGALRDTIATGLEVGKPAGNPTDKEAQRKVVETAKKTALLLGLVPLAIWLIFLEPAVNEIEAGFDVGFSLEHYSALDIVFVLLTFSWLLIAFVLLDQYSKLRRKEKKLIG
ncbi:MAG TPA: hypothetical protein VFS54_11290 [Solirubrobacterales bacterium]|nr:hypothetical protein [Solirubrobacterales bacterium]